MEIEIDDLSRPQVHALLAAHLEAMHAGSPAESVHALPLDSLRGPDITVWTAWEDGTLLGIGALKELDHAHGEVKSMRTADAARGRGVATALLGEILRASRERGYARVSLETGRDEPFWPAHRLYERHGFVNCPPFADYGPDPLSRFMTREVR
ncbi:GNAT family N-acetyltransferase [Demequina sp. NBRC 110055]|uniref:GNAT family N-acetyltransferase n=1 Tax=Demequina sp. NBRC 110055 TaxID=1570344 RepID=UPI000A078FE7|nr:GNAT family N-acetyltransferase [Demequina sp. NBRC 110055]